MQVWKSLMDLENSNSPILLTKGGMRFTVKNEKAGLPWWGSG